MREKGMIFVIHVSCFLISLLRSFQLHHIFNLDNENSAEDTPTIIDRKVPFDVIVS